ncbi:uncharacterized protein LOC126273228 [Schistocerca gregaria]|uniref:uncharacterized protein LOC126273228 n=1 Tax=Schistocerca gregaria TaxID=7010 RepID=UPI00211EEA66|nr:uncharacterized protein LOC126273228 [Schistocerca gregaria]
MDLLEIDFEEYVLDIEADLAEELDLFEVSPDEMDYSDSDLRWIEELMPEEDWLADVRVVVEDEDASPVWRSEMALLEIDFEEYVLDIEADLAEELDLFEVFPDEMDYSDTDLWWIDELMPEEDSWRSEMDLLELDFEEYALDIEADLAEELDLFEVFPDEMDYSDTDLWWIDELMPEEDWLVWQLILSTEIWRLEMDLLELGFEEYVLGIEADLAEELDLFEVFPDEMDYSDTDLWCIDELMPEEDWLADVREMVEDKDASPVREVVVIRIHFIGVKEFVIPKRKRRHREHAEVLKLLTATASEDRVQPETSSVVF